jgi:hypothetical protein
MRALSCCLALIGLLGACAAQDLKDTYGKTNTQILAMGYDKWYAFYTEKAGETTQGMAGANYRYATAIEWRNKGLLSNLPAIRRKSYERLAKAMDDFGTSVIHVERVLNGGGTLFQITFSSNAIDLQQTLYGLLVGKVKPAPPRVVSDVRKELTALEASFQKAPADTWKYEYKREDTAKYVKKAKDSFNQILSEAKALTRKQSDLILEYCRSAIVDSRMEGRE